MSGIETGNRAPDQSVNYSFELGKITTEIKNLVDQREENDVQAKENLKTSLNKTFLSGIAEFLNQPGNEWQKAELENSVKDVLSKHMNDGGFETEYKSLIDLANALSIDYKWGQEEVVNPEEPVSERPEDLKFEWGIPNIPEPTDDEKNNRKFFNNINEKPDNAPEGEKSKLETFEDKIRDEYLVAIDTLLASWLDSNQKANLEEIKKDLGNVLNVMWNPNKDNTRKLQDFILTNLDENSKEQFKKDNHFREWSGFDWDFGVKTFEWLKNVLSKIENHINNLKDYLKKLDDNKKNEILDNLRNGDRTFNKWGTPEEFIASLTLPGWVSAVFANEEDKNKLNEEWPQDIKLNVTIWGETHEITVKVNITPESTGDAAAATTESTGEWAGDAAPEWQTNSEPISVGDGQHLVMKNSSTLATTYKLPWATFYSADVYAWAEWEQAQPQFAESTELNEDWESVYYVKFNGMPNVYKIRVNVQGGLFPITTEYNHFVDGLESSALIKNNECCTNYLRDKLWILPISNEPWGDITIQWNRSVNDYTIKSFWQEITIEPMTMDKKWVSKDLWVCLKMLNLTNYLTSWINKDLKWTDPNLRLRGGNLQVQTTQGWKDVSEKTLSDFWLKWFDEWDMKRFVRYNNGEHWDDNWDAKKPNRPYKKIDIASRAEILWWSQTSGETVGRRFSIGSSSARSGGGVDAPQIQADGAPASQEVRWEVIWNRDELENLLLCVDSKKLWKFNYDYDRNEHWEFVFEDWVEQWDTDPKYIEIWWHKFYKSWENFDWLWYKNINVDWESFLYVWDFKNGKIDWMWMLIPSSWPLYIWDCKDWLMEWMWTLELSYVDWSKDTYKWDFKRGVWWWDGKFTWSNWGEYTWKFSVKENNGKIEYNRWNEFDVWLMSEWKYITKDWQKYDVKDGKYKTEDWQEHDLDPVHHL